MTDKPVRIPLNHAKHALVSADDAPRVALYRWHAQEDHGRWYAARGERVGSGHSASVHTVWMHRAILCAPPGLGVTHLNHDGLDNRRENLRVVTRGEIGAVRRLNCNNTSGYRGVSFDKPSGKWRATITVGGVKRSLGYYATAEDAARAWDAKVKELYGSLARLNFPSGENTDPEAQVSPS